jgi:hypothetical protein
MKERTAIQRSVTALLDELAPEKVLKREHVRAPIEPYRTATGCVLQAATAAVSVSWFGEASADAALGELHVIVWRGIVSRRGAPRRPDGAAITQQLVLRPVQQPSDRDVWRTTTGAGYDTAGLASHCVALLEEQMGQVVEGEG